MENEKGALRFIVDEPAEVDFFNTHTPVASAIARSIIGNPALRVIGLLGRWGSGKSTIVRDLGGQLQASDRKYLPFSYDAWLHQHDPLRRSFLESLVGFLDAKGLIDSEAWDKKLKRLSGSLEVVDRYESPVITTEAKLFFLVAAFVALGASFLKGEIFRDALGESVTRSGVWTLTLALSLIIFPILFWVTRTIILKRKGEKATYFPALILNKNFSHVTTHTTKPIEPTSIEFGQAFRDLMKEVQKNQIRLVIIIDNIDRVDEEEAMKIWASVRSFFLSSTDDNSLVVEPYHPIVVLPIDDRSITQMFSVGSDASSGERLARSFIDKTFDVTFEVPAPVMSDWKRYLADRMRYCLGSTFTEEYFFRTRQFLEAWFDSTNTPITPREINKSLNRLVATLTQWDGRGIPFETIAYFSINRSRIISNLRQEISRVDHPLSSLSEDWAREIAALHFGVGVDLAAQVLMTDPVKKAILEDRPELLNSYQKVSGFHDILEQVTANLPEDTLRPAPNIEIITNAARVVSQEPSDGVWHALAWQNLIRAFNTFRAGVLPQNLFDRIVPFFEHVEARDAENFVATIERIIDPLVSSDDLTATALKDAAEVGMRAIELARRCDVRVPIFDVSGDAKKYLQRLAALHSFPDVQQRLRTNSSRADVSAEVVRRMTDAEGASTVPPLVALLTSPSAELMLRGAFDSIDDWIAAAESAARNHSGETQVFRAAVNALITANGFTDQRRAALERLGTDGTFAAKLAAVTTSGDTEVTAAMLTTLIWKEADVAPPGGSWSSFFRLFPSAAAAINRHFDQLLAAQLPIHILFSCYESRSRLRDLISAVMEDRVRRGNLGRLSSETVLNNFNRYSRMVHWSLRDKFADLLTSYELFWRNIQSVPWSQNLYESALLLQKGGGETAARVKSELASRLQAATEADWLRAIEHGAEPYQIATKLLEPHDLKLGVSSSLTTALESGASAAASGSKAMRERWFELAETSSPVGRRKAMEAMGAAALGLGSVDKVKLLKAGGSRLLSEAGFVKEPDKAVEKLILPLMRGAKGRALLSERSSQVRPLVRAASVASRGRVQQLLEEFLTSTDEDRRQWSDKTLRSWGLKSAR